MTNLAPVLLATTALLLPAGCGAPSPSGGGGAGGSASSGPGTGGAGGEAATSGTGAMGGAGGTGGGMTPPAWQTVLDGGDLDGVALSVWGSAPGDVYAVGGPLGNDGFETLAVHFDGQGWQRLHPGGTETYWWVAGSGPQDVWMVGEKGRITHWDGAAFEEHASGVTATLWGVWAASAKDAWAVGGTPNGGTGAPNDIVLHWDGAAWSPEPLPGAPLGRTLYKVWGSSADDVYAVGEKGTIWRRAGGAWTLLEPALTPGKLLTVSGCGAGEVYAVGGSAVLRSNGQTFAEVDVALTNLVNGVACGPSGSALLVGDGGQKQRLVGGAWIDEFILEPYDDLHGAWSDGQGAFWAAGGDFYGAPVAGKKRRGVVARFGAGMVSGVVQ